jgi:hypothetical protein
VVQQLVKRAAQEVRQKKTVLDFGRQELVWGKLVRIL